ncbi:MAG: 3-dehydroquinate synthase [Dehalococcoidia bacterium]|nr:3-dehydroquinate synthase [Dehalococcoidia bacterium]
MSVGAGALGLIGEELSRLGFSGTVVVVTDERVAGLFADAVERSLLASGLTPQFVVIPPGEQQKSLETASMMYGRLNELGAERATPLVALGGGVVGDLTGFVAATYFRGLPLVHVPTTLLAQVDSSIGGKVAVNHGRLKNNIGAFHQPAAIIADTSCLACLPEREFRNGLAEVIKSAAIRDEAFFSYLEQDIGQILGRDADALEHVVSVTARIKASVVEEDEKDTGIRNILNYGHTIGHGVESASGFSLCHGECVAIGMVAAGYIAASLGVAPASEMERQRRLLVEAGLPVVVPDYIDAEDVLSAMTRDKKISKGRLRFALLSRIGDVALHNDVPVDLAREAVMRSYAIA